MNIETYIKRMRTRLRARQRPQQAPPTPPTRRKPGRPCTPGRYDWLEVLAVGQTHYWPWEKDREPITEFQQRMKHAQQACRVYKKKHQTNYIWSEWIEPRYLGVNAIGCQGWENVPKGQKVTRIL